MTRLLHLQAERVRRHLLSVRDLAKLFDFENELASSLIKRDSLNNIRLKIIRHSFTSQALQRGGRASEGLSYAYERSMSKRR